MRINWDNPDKIIDFALLPFFALEKTKHIFLRVLLLLSAFIWFAIVAIPCLLVFIITIGGSIVTEK
jgi:hypothetical protein